MKLRSLGTLFTVVGKIVGVSFKIVEAVSHTPIPELILTSGIVMSSMAVYHAYNCDTDKTDETEEYEPGKFRMVWNENRQTPGTPIIDEIRNFRIGSAVDKLCDLYTEDVNLGSLALKEAFAYCSFSLYGLFLGVRTVSNIGRMNALKFSAKRLSEYCEFVDIKSVGVISVFNAKPELLAQPYALEYYNFAKLLNSVYHEERSV